MSKEGRIFCKMSFFRFKLLSFFQPFADNLSTTDHATIKRFVIITTLTQINAKLLSMVDVWATKIDFSLKKNVPTHAMASCLDRIPILALILVKTQFYFSHEIFCITI